jgi:spore coat polysaccharide biosynthesis protein SpsF
MVLAVLQARMSSTRLAGKVMRPILGEPMIARQIERLRRAQRLSGIVVATSTNADDDVIAAEAARLRVGIHRGPLDDVLSRFVGALAAHGRPKTFVRLTADCPLADWRLIDACIEAHDRAGADYTNSVAGWSYPKGLDVEVCETAALLRADREATSAYDREHVMPYIAAHPELFRIEHVAREPPLRFRWTVDTPQDFAFVTQVYAALYSANPAFTTEDILAWQAANPDKVIANVVE